jgi:hypothetical protein
MRPISGTEDERLMHVNVTGDHNTIVLGANAAQAICFDDGRWDELRRALADVGLPSRGR